MSRAPVRAGAGAALLATRGRSSFMPDGMPALLSLVPLLLRQLYRHSPWSAR